jgi:hypothetical protein
VDLAGRRPALVPSADANGDNGGPAFAAGWAGALRQQAPMPTVKTAVWLPLRRGQPLPHCPPADANGENGPAVPSRSPLQDAAAEVTFRHQTALA